MMKDESEPEVFQLLLHPEPELTRNIKKLNKQQITSSQMWPASPLRPFPAWLALLFLVSAEQHQYCIIGVSSSSTRDACPAYWCTCSRPKHRTTQSQSFIYLILID